jgi:protein-L-isoaspartate(D-aspartate) O-methyltransferase
MGRTSLGRWFWHYLICAAVVAQAACSSQVPSGKAGAPAERAPAGISPDITLSKADDWASQRQQMVEDQVIARGIRNGRVLRAMRRVSRHEFVPEAVRQWAYADSPLPIGKEQTISQPYIVALMTEVVDPQPGHRILEVGTGSGYQAAVLAELVGDVYTIELLPALAEAAKLRLRKLGYRKVQVRAGDGYVGWPEAAPFDAILVTCGAEHVPEPLFHQLKVGGRMVIPMGDRSSEQWLRVLRKGQKGERLSQDLIPVRFVPLRRTPEVAQK